MNHTPIPWRVGDGEHSIFGPPQGLPPLYVAQQMKGSDARYAVHACNHFEGLLEAAKKALEFMERVEAAEWEGGIRDDFERAETLPHVDALRLAIVAAEEVTP